MGYNLYRDLRSLLPGPRLVIGTVTVVETGRVTVELPDGSTVVALGSASVGENVYVRDGAVEGVAPTLSVVEIEI